MAQISNSTNQEKEKYKNQRNELKTRLGELENRLILTCGENERFSFSLKEKDREIENLKSKLQDQDQQHSSSISYLKSQLNETFTQKIV